MPRGQTQDHTQIVVILLFIQCVFYAVLKKNLAYMTPESIIVGGHRAVPGGTHNHRNLPTDRLPVANCLAFESLGTRTPA